MPFKLFDRVQETSTTMGTGNFTLAGAVTGFQTFASRYSTGDTLYYAIQEVNAGGTPTGAWEVGYGTYSAANTLTRTTVLSSSNSDALVNFASGDKRVFVTMTATQGSAGNGYAKYLAASLEPDAIESLKTGTFSYAVGPSETKMLLASYSTRLGSAGRMEQRNPQRFLSMRNVTLVGLDTGSAAIVSDPSAPTYVSPWATYYSRLEQIAELPLRNVQITSASQEKPFLPGPYGAIIVQNTTFNLTWLILKYRTGAYGAYGTCGINLWDEINDADYNRIGNSLSMAISKRVAGNIASGLGTSTGGAAGGSISFILCPSDWSVIADPVAASYSFRDDFMGASLDTSTTWTRTQSTAGNIEIDTTYQWCKFFGVGTWNTNGLYEQGSHARSGQPTVVVDVFPGIDQGGSGYGMIGWSTGAGINYSDLAHAINFAGSGVLNIYENGTARGTVGSGFTEGVVYRIKIQALSGGGATYSIQGGTQYPVIGGGSWTNITPGTSNSATSSLHAGAAAWNGSSYLSDFRVY